MNQKGLLLSRRYKHAKLNILFIRKILYIFLLVLFFNLKFLAQQSKAWNYPIRYGTTDWEKFKTSGEKINAYNIPDSLLKNMTTKDLVETCMNYPDIILIMMWNNVQLGYDKLKLMFNGFRELEKRKDAGGELIKLYQKVKPEDIMNYKSPDDRGDFSLKITFLEILLAQKPILQNLNDDEATSLFSCSSSVYERKLSIIKYYEQYGLTTPCLIGGRLLEVKVPITYRQLTSDNPHIHVFLNESIVSEKSDFDQIVNASKSYLKTKGH
jgi:hypothetical protein